MKSSPVTHAFEFPKEIKSKRLVEQISNRYSARFAPSRRLRLRYYDTFDWRLYNRRLLLIRIGDECRLRRLDDDATVGACRVSGIPTFWWSFPEGQLRDRLSSIVQERALMPVGEVGLRVVDINLLNSDDKTVVRARVEEGEAFNGGGEAAPIRVVNILPVKGYGKEARRFARFLSKIGLSSTSRSTFGVAVGMSGREPGDYSSKLGLRLDPSMTAQVAAGVIFGRLLDTMERNVSGIREDIDTEFLHDFRVAIRRTRSGLSQIKGIVPDAIANEYRIRFADVARDTNRLRDLDVYLLNRGAYGAMLPEELRPALDPLFDEISKQRAIEHASAVRMLESDRYRDLVRDWGETLKAFGTEPIQGDKANVSVLSAARRFITKRYTRVMDDGERIDDESPDSALHALRIDCKKLRYLLEFFTSLYPAEEIGVFVKQLKRLQDNLGEFNDLSVQQNELISFLKQSENGASVETAAAVGALITALKNRQQEVRSQFSETFNAFAGQENKDRFQRLFRKA